MYVERIQLINYGPIDRLDISFPFNGDSPKPLLLVGANGSGKSIFLSHIANGLLVAQGIAFPESPEVEEGKVYKIRTTSYIKMKKELYFAKVNYEKNLFLEELHIRQPNHDHAEPLSGLEGPEARELFGKMERGKSSVMDQNFHRKMSVVEGLFSSNCVLYFPPNRFEEPAWLNEANLKARARHMDSTNLKGYTNRRVINHSPLEDNKDWLFEVIYDQFAFELQTSTFHLLVANGTAELPLPIYQGYSGSATALYEIAVSIVQTIVMRQDARFGIGGRHSRRVAIESKSGQIVPNIFQMSSGETSLLNLFFSILRDFDLSGSSFSSTEDFRGIVVVDEIDLHLHANHQYEILPTLIRMFPNIQFIVTTHSPLFVLGMAELYGENGFALYQLPQGQQISPEDFSEFGSAYRSFAETKKYSEAIRQAIEKSRMPIVFVEGKTNVKYIERAAELLSKKNILSEISLKNPGGSGDLNKIWKNTSWLSEIEMQQVVLLYDCDEPKCGSRGKLFQRSIPKKENHPLKKGIENLFDKPILERAMGSSEAYIDVNKRSKRERGAWTEKPEEWTVNNDEKTNLCDWLCENGTAEEFQNFQCVFDLLEKLLGIGSPTEAEQPQDSFQQLASS